MAGIVTVKFTLLLSVPFTRTITGPVVVRGTKASMVVSVQEVGVVSTPLNSKVIDPGSKNSPKLNPVSVTGLPIAPRFGVILETVGRITWKLAALLDAPFTVTTTGPESVTGTDTSMEVLLQLVTGALTPLKVTTLVPCVFPKNTPCIVTGLPMTPDDEDKLPIAGGMEFGIMMLDG